MSADALSAVLVAIIGGVFLVVVELVRRGGKRAARGAAAERAAHPDDESGEHAHTRTLIREGLIGLHLRFDALERARGLEREQEQVGRSAEAIGRKIDAADVAGAAKDEGPQPPLG